MRTSLHSLFQQHAKNHQQSSREPLACRSSLVVDFEDTDSHFSFSSSSSPSQICSNEQDQYLGGTSSNTQKKSEDQDEPEDASNYSPKVQVIAASGDNIIAVANPALAMSPAMIAPLVEARDNRGLEKD